jgi:membrane protease YdiL (CAAX protease family)
MITSENKKRIIIFLVIAFTLAWASALVIYLTGGITNSKVIEPTLRLTLAAVLMATGMMWAPAVAHILTRLLTREGWQDLWLKPKLSQGWKYWLIAWFAPGILIIAGAVAYFLIFPQNFDANLSGFQALLEAQMAQYGSTETLPITPWTLLILQGVQALLLAPVLNALFTFGEEFGWRAYLLPKLMPLGGRKAVLISGVIWGVWHWPVILMGYNYGFDYPGAPWLGLLGMVWFTTMLGIIISWLTIRAGSVWPAVIAHGAGNGIAAIGVFAVLGYANPLLGPSPVGLIGGIFITILALNIFFLPGALELPKPDDMASPPLEVTAD